MGPLHSLDGEPKKVAGEQKTTLFPLFLGAFRHRLLQQQQRAPFVFAVLAPSKTHFFLSFTKASCQLEITAPPSSKSFRHNLD